MTLCKVYSNSLRDLINLLSEKTAATNKNGTAQVNLIRSLFRFEGNKIFRAFKIWRCCTGTHYNLCLATSTMVCSVFSDRANHPNRVQVQAALENNQLNPVKCSSSFMIHVKDLTAYQMKESVWSVSNPIWRFMRLLVLPFRQQQMWMSLQLLLNSYNLCTVGPHKTNVKCFSHFDQAIEDGKRLKQH